MSHNSRMLQRVRSDSQKKTIIPRKGRIRAILLAVAALGAMAFYTSRDATDAAGSLTPNNGSKAAGKKQQLNSSVDIRRVGRSIDFQELRSIFRSHTPSFRTPVETIPLKSQTLQAHVSIDTALQSYARRLMRRYHPLYGAIVAVEPSTGRVVALLSYTNEDAVPLDNRLYCRSLFPAASIFKAVTAGAALDKGSLLPKSEIRHVGRNHTLYKFQLERNLDVYRNVSLTDAFAYSMNPVFGRIGIYVTGCSGLRDYANRFGFEEEIPFELPTDTSRVGACDSSFALAELASGFNQKTTLSPLHGALIGAAIVNGGRMPRPSFVDSVSDAKDGGILYRTTPSTWKQPVGVGTARKLRKMMSQVARYGTARSAFRYVKKSYRFKNTVYGGKTGNVDKDGMGKTDWFIGFIRHETDSRQQLAVGIVTVHGAYWTVHSSFLGAEVMRRYVRSIQIADEKRLQSVESSAGDGDEADG